MRALAYGTVASSLTQFPMGAWHLYDGVTGTPKAEVPPQYSVFFVADGDSTIKGQAAAHGWENTVGYTFFDQYISSDTDGWIAGTNLSVGGSFLSSVVGRAASQDAQIAANPGYEDYCLVILIGVNDGAATISTASYPAGSSGNPDWIDTYKAYLTARRSAGFNRIVVCTITPYNNETPAIFNSLRGPTNNLIRGLVTSGHADAYLDLGSDYVMGDTRNLNPLATPAGPGTIWYHDYVHQSLLGHTREFYISAATLNAQAVTASTVVINPTFSPVAGVYETTQSVTLACVTPGSSIYYTVNGSTPTTGSTLYTGPISVSTSQTIKAIGAASGLTNSSVVSAIYTIGSFLTWSPVEAAIANGGGHLFDLTSTDHTATPSAPLQTKVMRASIALTGKKAIELQMNGYAGDGSYAALWMVKSTAAFSADCNSSITAYWTANLFGSASGSGVTVDHATVKVSRPQANGDLLMLAFDMDNGKLYTSENGGVTWGRDANSNPATGTNPDAHWTPGGTWWFAVTGYANAASGPAYVLPATITGIIPSGFTGLNA